MDGKKGRDKTDVGPTHVGIDRGYASCGRVPTQHRETILSLIHLHEEPFCILYFFHPPTWFHARETRVDAKSSTRVYFCALRVRFSQVAKNY
jgi:hypothetical protein